MSKLKWFKHYNTAHEGQLFGDLILTGRHEAALLAYIIMELISRFEDENRRGYASVPIDRLARAMNMKPSKIDRLLAEISAVSRSDLVCETDEEQPRNRSFLMRNWLKYQETRGGKRSAKNLQKSGRSKKGEGRSKKEDNTIPASGDTAPQESGVDVWNAYREAFRSRYGIEPVRNGKVNSACLALKKRLGADAVAVVKFYLTHSDPFYIKNQHDIGLCLAKAEQLYTQLKTNSAVAVKQNNNHQPLVVGTVVRDLS